MNLDKRLFAKLYDPPAVVPTVVDVACVWVDLSDDPPPFCGVVFRLQHPDLDAPFDQLFRLPKAQMLELFGLFDALVDQ